MRLASAAIANTTLKENRKGSIRSYNSRRRILFILISMFVSIFFMGRNELQKNKEENSKKKISLFRNKKERKKYKSSNDNKKHKSSNDDNNSNGKNNDPSRSSGREQLTNPLMANNNKSHNDMKNIRSSVRTGTIANHPIRNIDYGIPLPGNNREERTPVVMIRSSLDKTLHDRFLQEYLYSCSENELNQIKELDNRVKVPTYIYEGYYHSLPTNDKVYSRNPNPLIGKDFMKPPASPFTRAFFDAFRYVNREIFNTLKENLLMKKDEEDVSSSSISNNERNNNNNNKNDDENDICHIFAKWIDQGYHFGDLSIQIHYGRGNEEKLISGAAWHTDAENSLLHLAVTLRGNRVLHSKRIRGSKNNTINSSSSSNKQRLSHHQEQQQVPREILEEQRPGNIYLSSSTLMQHAPQFRDTDYSTRVIAIHARILYTSATINYFRSMRNNKSWKRLTTILANNLSTANIRIPSLEQVESQLLRL